MLVSTGQAAEVAARSADHATSSQWQVAAEAVRLENLSLRGVSSYLASAAGRVPSLAELWVPQSAAA